MCGRYAFYLPPSILKARLGLENLLNIPPRYNCAPGQDLPVVIKNRMGLARWGFRPEWAQKDLINARSETVAEKPVFQESWARGRRCLVPANGFYEWQRDSQSGVNQPFYICHERDDFLCLAGLWTKIGEQVQFTVLTKAADANLSPLHHRAPVMIAPEEAAVWFHGGEADARAMVVRSSTLALRFWPVGKAVGNAAHDDESLIAQAG